MIKKPLYKIFLCSYLNPLSDTKCKFIKHAGVVLKRKKSGYTFFEVAKRNYILEKYKNKRSIEVLSQEDRLMLPSFFDMHFHWVQDEVRDKPKASLLTWLEKYTWPYEAKFKDKKYSLKKAKRFSEELISVGTLGGACYSSIHEHAVDHAIKYFIGDYIIGNVLMDMNSPKNLLQKKSDALKMIKNLSAKYKKKYALTPRFALSTTPELMKEGAKLIKANQSFTQTHLSENQFEIKTILDIYKKLPQFKNVKSYTEIYKKCHILGKKSLLGHGIHLDQEELNLLSKTGSHIIHCPSSNAPVKDKGLGSGLFDFRKIEKMKISWALGSDIGAGPNLSMFDVISSFVLQNKRKGITKATYIKALYRATLAGAKILGLEKKCGNLEIGKYANFILLDLPKAKVKNLSAEKTLEFLIETYPSNRAARNTCVAQTYYMGKQVYSKTKQDKIE